MRLGMGAGKRFMDARWSKWDRWMEAIRDDLRHLCTWRMVFLRAVEILEANPRLQGGDVFGEFLKVSYASTAAMGIRRQVKIDEQSISMMRLLSEIAAHPASLSRERYKALFGSSPMLELADEMFDGLAGSSGPHVDPQMVERDMADLRANAEAVEEFADRRVAHLDTRDLKRAATYDDVHNCVGLLEQTYLKYHSLFRAETLDRVLPSYQYDWEAVFKEPWISPCHGRADA